MKPTLLIIFGFTGDLVNRYFLPALYHLELDGALPKDLAIMATTRRPIDLDNYKEKLKKRVHEMREPCDEEVLARLFEKIELTEVDVSNRDEYGRFNEQVNKHDEQLCKNRLLYFAVPPKLFNRVLENVVETGLHKCGDGISARLMIEKPFGHDTDSARELLSYINSHFGPEHLYPIDHYLAKETVQNILYFRFHNPIVRAIWNPKHISQIQISAIEQIDIQGRVNFYEQTGALRDMVQSHLLQLAALATMDEPQAMEAKPIRMARQQILESFARTDEQSARERFVRAQYQGYKDEVENPDSNVETYVAAKFTIDNDKWRNVPIYLQAGKAMHMKKTEITLVYNDPSTPDADDNVLTLRIQPNEGVAMRLTAKKPGLENDIQQVTMDYCYQEDESSPIHDAYEKILIDAMRGDQTLFPTDKEIINNWELIEPVLEYWNSSPEGLVTYEKGSEHVDAADALLEGGGHEWVALPNICIPRWNSQNKA